MMAFPELLEQFQWIDLECLDSTITARQDQIWALKLICRSTEPNSPFLSNLGVFSSLNPEKNVTSNKMFNYLQNTVS